MQHGISAGKAAAFKSMAIRYWVQERQGALEFYPNLSHFFAKQPLTRIRYF